MTRESVIGVAPPADRSMDVAAVDLGSNSFHMLVARAVGAELQVIDRLREPVRLASGLDAERQLQPEAQGRALACLQRFGQRIAHIPDERIRVVGTNTMREMRRGQEFLAAAEAALGHSIEIIAGMEEARLVYGGVVHGLEAAQARRLVVDIGGGSTELIIGRGTEPRLMESVSLGCVVHTQRHFSDGTITRSRFRRARLAARVELEYLEQRYRRAGWDLAIGASGTVRGIWRVIRAEGWSDLEITREALEKLVKMVIARGHVQALDFPALREDRRPVFVGGLAVLAGVFDALALERMQTSDRALREGLVYDLLGRLQDRDVREEAVRAMAMRFGVDDAHALAVSGTAAELLRQAEKPWRLDGRRAGTLLRWAAQLHEIGLVVAHSSYHKHGDYLLRNADLQGFSQTDQQLLATLVRLHRGKFSVSALEGLPGAWIEPIRHLAVLFRLAVLLHRSRTPEPDPPLQLEASARGLALQFPAGWLDEHPLTQADLEREAEYLAAIGLRLRYA